MNIGERTDFFEAYIPAGRKYLTESSNPVTNFLDGFEGNIGYARIENGEVQKRLNGREHDILSELERLEANEDKESEASLENAYISLGYNNGKMIFDLRILNEETNEDLTENTEFNPEEHSNYIRIQGFETYESFEQMKKSFGSNEAYVHEILDNLR